MTEEAFIWNKKQKQKDKEMQNISQKDICLAWTDKTV